MLDDEDDKKNPSDDYSELSDLFDSNKSEDSLESLLKSHGIDLGSDAELGAMEDFSLTDPMLDATDSPDVPAKKAKRGKKESAPVKEEPPLSLDDFSESMSSETSLFDDEPIVAEKPSSAKKLNEDPSMFESSDFDDVNADFPEGAPSEKLGEDVLFADYEAEPEATFDNAVTEESPVNAGGAGGESGGGDDLPPPKSPPNMKRLAARLGVMALLALVIYGGMKLFLGHKTEQIAVTEPMHPHMAHNAAPIHATEVTTTKPNTVMPVTPPSPSEMPSVSVAPTDNSAEEASVAPAAGPTTAAPPTLAQDTSNAAMQPPAVTAPAASQVPMPNVSEVTAPSTAPMAATPTNVPVPGGVTSGLPATPPVVTSPASTTVSIPATDMNSTMAVKAPLTTDVVPVNETSQAAMSAVPPLAAAANTSMANANTNTGDMNQKLDNLEMALQTLNQRLSQTDMGSSSDDRTQRLERLVNDSTAPEMQSTLEAAVKKMQALDVKLDRIAALQKDVRHLNTEVKALKEDVMAQTNIVGEQQRLFNDNVQLAQMKEPGPVKMVVQAAIPGRAWLRSERGELLTVIPGDEVPGYGRVVSIDAASGTVVTSSRAVFREQ